MGTGTSIFRREDRNMRAPVLEGEERLRGPKKALLKKPEATPLGEFVRTPFPGGQ